MILSSYQKQRPDVRPPLIKPQLYHPVQLNNIERHWKRYVVRYDDPIPEGRMLCHLYDLGIGQQQLRSEDPNAGERAQVQ